MIGGSYGEREIFTSEELRVFVLAAKCVAACSYLERFDENPVRCHELVRAAAEVLRCVTPLAIVVVDGSFGAVDHSWLTLGTMDVRRHWSSPTILDLYVPGRLPQVQLFDTSSAVPINHYKGALRTDVREDVVLDLKASMARAVL